MLSKISPTNLLPSNMQLNIETYLCITLLLAFLKLLGHVRLFVTPCPPGSSVHGITQARILELVAIPFSRRSSQPRDQTQVSRIYFYCWVIFHYRDEPYSSIHLGPIFLTCKGRLSSSTLDSCHQMTQVQCSAWCPASHPLYLPSPTSFTLA